MPNFGFKVQFSLKENPVAFLTFAYFCNVNLYLIISIQQRWHPNVVLTYANGRISVSQMGTSGFVRHSLSQTNRKETDGRQLEVGSLTTSLISNTASHNIPEFDKSKSHAEHSHGLMPLASFVQSHGPSYSEGNNRRQGELSSHVPTQSYNVTSQKADGGQMKQTSLPSTQSLYTAPQMAGGGHMNQTSLPTPQRNSMVPQRADGRQIKDTNLHMTLMKQNKSKFSQKDKIPVIFQHYLPVGPEPTNVIDKFKRMCKYCSKCIWGSRRITSNFHTHIKVSERHTTLDFRVTRFDICVWHKVLKKW